MTAIDSGLGSISGESESSWAEAVDTWGTRYQIVNGVDLSGFTQEKIPLNPVRQRPHEDVQHIRGVKRGSFTMELVLGGHGGTTASTALTATDLYNLLVDVIGAGYAAQVTDDIAGGTAAVPTVDASGTWAPNTLCRVGVLGDTRCEGQWAAIASEAANSVTLLTALPATPNAGDVVFGALLVHPSETGSVMAAVTSKRFLLQTANRQIKARGCFPTAISIRTFAPMQVPHVSITWQASWWDDANETFPDVTATDAKVGRVVSSGELVIEARGTTTRTTYSYRAAEVNIALNVVPLEGPGAVNPEQVIVGARRTMAEMTLAFEFDSEAAGTQAWRDLWKTDEASLTNRHILLGLSVEDGKALGIYVPNALIVGPSPTQRDGGGLNRERIEFKAVTNLVTTNDRTLAAWQLGIG